MNQAIEHFRKKFPQAESGKILASLTTFQVGGPADLYYALEESSMLPKLLEEAQSQNIPLIILGGGSNVIFSEEGFRGLVIHLTNKSIIVENDHIIADAGALLSQVIQTSLKNNLTGMEKLMGIPGTIGGAVRGNAGAFGVEIKNFFEKAEIYTPGQDIRLVDQSYLNFSYRESTIKHNSDILLKIWLKLEKKDGDEALKEALEILKSRAGAQPSGKCSGSFFKNPRQEEKNLQGNQNSSNEVADQPSESPMQLKVTPAKTLQPKTAGFLLDQAGCKGLQVGGARVSEKHANWIMNLGNATQKDVIELSGIMKRRVFDQFGISLEREVQLIGTAGFLP